MSRLFPEPTLDAIVGPEGDLMFDDNDQALIFKNEAAAQRRMGNNISSDRAIRPATLKREV